MANWNAGTVTLHSDGRTRCDWRIDWETNTDLLRYHDEEWGTPRREITAVFEGLCLNIFQAGLGWLTVFHKRQAFRDAFHQFDPAQVATMTPRDVDQLLLNPAIIRNRAKIEATIHNAVVAMESDTDLADLIWSYAPNSQGRWRSLEEVPAMSAESQALASAMKKQGYKFVGPTIAYAFMQSLGIVNDHVVGCFRARDENPGLSESP